MAMTVVKGYMGTAEELAVEHAKTGVQEIYLFPDDTEKEIRLVELDKNTPPEHAETETMQSYSFPIGARGFSCRLSIALIRPEEKMRLRLPSGWGDWSNAKRLYPSAKSKKIRRKE
jgi:hypothetical protein